MNITNEPVIKQSERAADWPEDYEKGLLYPFNGFSAKGRVTVEST